MSSKWSGPLVPSSEHPLTVVPLRPTLTVLWAGCTAVTMESPSWHFPGGSHNLLFETPHFPDPVSCLDLSLWLVGHILLLLHENEWRVKFLLPCMFENISIRPLNSLDSSSGYESPDGNHVLLEVEGTRLLSSHFLCRCAFLIPDISCAFESLSFVQVSWDLVMVYLVRIFLSPVELSRQWPFSI